MGVFYRLEIGFPYPLGMYYDRIQVFGIQKGDEMTNRDFRIAKLTRRELEF